MRTKIGGEKTTAENEAGEENGKVIGCLGAGLQENLLGFVSEGAAVGVGVEDGGSSEGGIA